jgi:DNA polymerase-3 subunit epsilon
MLPDGTFKHRALERRFNPGCLIPPGATKVHGITDEMVKDCPPFSSVAHKIQALFRGKDILGFNLRRLDLPLLDAELRRCDLKLELDPDVRIIDAFGIYSKKNPRTLSDAVKAYCGEDHTDAHGAGADADATLRVLLAQLKAYPDLDTMTVEALADFSLLGDNRPVDLAGKLYRDKDGDVCFGFSAHKGQKVRDDPGFARWMLSKDFPGSTLDVIEEELNRIRKEEHENSRTRTEGPEPQGEATTEEKVPTLPFDPISQ